ncbi:MAG: hypothetical protein LBV67_10110, partial [Streptococcaceae bacterium]|nr:hypothetical protein [Streptococcaceae bacterium]
MSNQKWTQKLVHFLMIIGLVLTPFHGSIQAISDELEAESSQTSKDSRTQETPLENISEEVKGQLKEMENVENVSTLLMSVPMPPQETMPPS